IPASDTLLHLVASADNTSIWTVSEGGLLHRFDKQTEQFDRFSSRNLPGLPVSPRLLYGDDYEALWIAGFTEEGELALASLRSKTMLVKTQTLLSLDRGNLPRLTGLQRSTDRTFWLGVETHLVSLAEDGTVATYALPEELGEMRSFLFDDQENIWMATTRGIAIFNVGDEDFFLFPEDYDYLAQPYQFRSALVHSPEEMLFCGQGGCTYVNATTIERYYNSTRKQTSLSSDLIRLTAFLLNGKEVTEGPMSAESITRSRALSLNYDQNNFSFELSLLDFDRPTDNDFYYKLEGYDSYWRQTGDRNTIYFAQVPPGEYTLLVKGYNSVGAFGKAHPVKITVLPPWWLTWWAYVVYALLGLALVYAIYRFQLSRQIAKSEAQRLQDLNVAKSRLYTNITHEFRTPLTVILGMTEQLERSATAAQREPVEMIERNGRSLLSLVNQMLDLAKLESGQMDLHLQQSDLISYLKYLVESFHSFAESRGVKIHFLSDLETQVMDFDAGKIQQVISNLLSNAIKFTPTGGDIYLLANTTGGAPAAELLIQVRDTGAGISPERLPYIFERFYQADDSHTREQSGTGIGLALVAELVKLMQGKISAKSELGKGTEIAIRLPIAQSAARTEELLPFAKEEFKALYREAQTEDAEEVPVASGDDRPTVLIVEDNVDVRQYLQTCLADRFDLLTAENGQLGLEKAIEMTPDLIISDVMMPVKDGYTLARELKSDQRASHIPIIMLTAKADLNSRLEGLGQGVDAYLAKPFHPRELRLRIHKLLEQRDRLRSHYLGLSGATSANSNGTGEQVENSEDAFVLKIRDIILERLDDTNLDVQLLTREVGMSQSQLHRKLTALTGLSANRFLRHVRLEQAQSLLRDPELTISAVAYETGYRDPSYFGRVFKQETGMTPAEWRREAVV
ncbi:MAG: hybrid sensor histidine kinase/response regulator transcription factor, partial [Bacteroidota bacterium]